MHQGPEGASVVRAEQNAAFPDESGFLETEGFRVFGVNQMWQCSIYE
jgi:hypothetical protein